MMKLGENCKKGGKIVKKGMRKNKKIIKIIKKKGLILYRNNTS